MKAITIDINGTRVSAEVEPRTHLGDFLRDSVRLTGTHLGCEHGVCGACTVLMDGEPVRSCITFAVSCHGRRVTTVEGYDADELMQRLRAAFNRHHALQCGYCTPGMLATARDIVLRLPEADEARVRLELAGNLCRCTGYMGIVAAILDVLAQLRAEPDPEIAALREQVRAGRFEPPPQAGVAGGIKPMPMLRTPAVNRAMTSAPAAAVTAVPDTQPPQQEAHEAQVGAIRGGTRIEASFELPYGRDAVWAFMGDLPAVAACLPGASIESQEGEKVKGRIAIKFGPMAAAFVGAAKLERHDQDQRAVLRGAGQDSLSRSRAQGDIAYQLVALGAQRTRVDVDMLYTLQGPLAQFSRSGLVKDFVRRLVADFGRQVEARMGGSKEALPTDSAAISPLRALRAVLWDRLRRWFTGGR
jgi:carbon-monoxide dehydrogenase small subunit